MNRRLSIVWILLLLTPWSHAAQLIVTALDRATDDPLAGAYVQIGPTPEVPFPGNWGFSDEGGQIILDDPGLVPGLPLTVAAEGYARLTVLACPVGAITVWCDPAVQEQWPDTSLVSGVVRGLPITSNDGNLDLGIVLGAIAPEQLLGGGMGLLVSAFLDTMHIGFPLNIDVPIPENLDIPSQTELLFVNFFKEPYTQRFRTGDTVDMICLGYRVNVNDLIAGEPQQITATKATASRDYPVAGDATVNHTCSVNFTHGVQASVSGLPSGSQGYVASVGELTGSIRKDRYVPLHGVQCPVGVDTTVSLSYLPGSGVFSDLAAYSGVAYADTSEQPTWGGGNFDWTPLTPGATRDFDLFYQPPLLCREGDLFSFEGYQVAGSPAADWTTSSFRLEDRSGGGPDSLVWEVVGPAAMSFFEIPQLGMAPGWTSLPDPSQTPAVDGLVWNCAVVSAPTVVLQEFLASPFRECQLFTFRMGDAPPLAGPGWVTVTAQTPQDLLVTWAPDPNALEYSVQWASAPWQAPQGSATTTATSYLDSGALPSTGSQRHYAVRSRAELSQSPPTPPVGGSSWEIDDGP